jgi:3-oxoacyl-[acyl-carrier protein] reductase
MNNIYNLSGKKVFITGGTGGIGSAAVKNFVEREKAEVFFTSSSQEKINKLMGQIDVSDTKVHSGICNMANNEDISLAVKDALEKMGKIDVLVCNAGTNLDKLFMRMTFEDWSNVININLNANFYLISQVFKKMMMQKSGSIILISSLVGSIGNIGQANYAASKAGLEGMARSLALESARFGVTVNSIAPGFITTEMSAKIPEDIKNKMTERIPMNHFGSTNDIYEMIAFLASDGAKYITGQTFHVNGGMYLN